MWKQTGINAVVAVTKMTWRIRSRSQRSKPNSSRKWSRLSTLLPTASGAFRSAALELTTDNKGTAEERHLLSPHRRWFLAPRCLSFVVHPGHAHSFRVLTQPEPLGSHDLITSCVS